jgi:hypothetical protein
VSNGADSEREAEGCEPNVTVCAVGKLWALTAQETIKPTGGRYENIAIKVSQAVS